MPDAREEAELARIVAAGPRGTPALAGAAVVSLPATWFGFHFLIFLPRDGWAETNAADAAQARPVESEGQVTPRARIGRSPADSPRPGRHG